MPTAICGYCTVLLKGKLKVLTQFLKLDSCIVKVETFDLQDVRIKSPGMRVEDQELEK